MTSEHESNLELHAPHRLRAGDRAEAGLVRPSALYCALRTVWFVGLTSCKVVCRPL
jgi:hypothetical protein